MNNEKKVWIKNPNEYIIFKRAIVNELLEKGFKLIRVGENFYDRKKSIFAFESTQELVDYMLEIKNRSLMS